MDRGEPAHELSERRGMLTYLVTRGHRYTMDTFLESWGGSAGEIRVLTHEDVFRFGEVPLGPCIFSDLERLSPAETKMGVPSSSITRPRTPGSPPYRLCQSP